MSTSLSPAGKYFNVGNPSMATLSTSLAVASIFAMMMSSWSAYISPSCSQIGASSLQCPHHGASAHTQTLWGVEEAILVTKNCQLCQPECYNLSVIVFRCCRESKQNLERQVAKKGKWIIKSQLVTPSGQWLHCTKDSSLCLLRFRWQSQLNQGWENFLTRRPQRVLTFDRRTRPGADVWSVMVIHLIRQK